MCILFHILVGHRFNYRPDRPPEGVVKASAIATSVTSEPVGGTVPTGAVGAMRDTGRALPSHPSLGRQFNVFLC